MSKEDTAILLISHGSTRPYGKVVFDEIKEKFIEKTGLKTEVGYMKVSEPSVAGAVNILAEDESINHRICIYFPKQFCDIGLDVFCEGSLPEIFLGHPKTIIFHNAFQVALLLRHSFQGFERFVPINICNPGSTSRCSVFG